MIVGWGVWRWLFYVAFIVHDRIRKQEQFFLFYIRSKGIISWSCYNNCRIIKFANLCWLNKICCFILFVFIVLGHIEVVKLLVTHTAEVTCKDKKSYTPLHAAASSGMISVVKYLLDLGVDVRKNKIKWDFFLFEMLLLVL